MQTRHEKVRVVPCHKNWKRYTVVDSCQLWEVLVPQAFNSGERVSLEHHHAWDEAVREIAGGLTIHRSAKGVWESPSGDIFQEVMIPVRIACTEDQMRKIMHLTRTHYRQEAVMAYLVSERVLLLTGDEFNCD